MPVVEHKQHFFFLYSFGVVCARAPNLLKNWHILQQWPKKCVPFISIDCFDGTFSSFFFLFPSSAIFSFIFIFSAVSQISLAFILGLACFVRTLLTGIWKTAGFYRTRNKLYNILYLFWQVWFLSCISHTSKKMCARLARKSQFDCIVWMRWWWRARARKRKPRTNLAIIHDFHSCISTFVRRDDLYQTTVTTVKSSTEQTYTAHTHPLDKAKLSIFCVQTYGM